MSEQRFANVWDAIEDSPAQALTMRLRSTLMIALRERIERAGLNQTEAATLLGVTPPRISDLVRGKIRVFGLESLVSMASAAGLEVALQVNEPAAV